MIAVFTTNIALLEFNYDLSGILKEWEIVLASSQVET